MSQVDVPKLTYPSSGFKNETCKDVPVVHAPSHADAIVLISGVRVSRVDFTYGLLNPRRLSRLQDGWRLPAVGGLLSAEERLAVRIVHEFRLVVRRDRATRRGRLHADLKMLRRLTHELAKVRAGRAPSTLATLQVSWPRFEIADYVFCLTRGQ